MGSSIQGRLNDDARRKANRRKPRAGYPVEQRPFTLEEIKEYLNREKIVCLLCGRFLRVLGVHLYSIHQMSIDTYTNMYGLPKHGSGTCQASKEKMTESLYNRTDITTFISRHSRPAQKVLAALPRPRKRPYEVERLKKSLRGTNGRYCKV